MSFETKQKKEEFARNWKQLVEKKDAKPITNISMEEASQSFLDFRLNEYAKKIVYYLDIANNSSYSKRERANASTQAQKILNSIKSPAKLRQIVELVHKIQNDSRN